MSLGYIDPNDPIKHIDYILNSIRKYSEDGMKPLDEQKANCLHLFLTTPGFLLLSCENFKMFRNCLSFFLQNESYFNFLIDKFINEREKVTNQFSKVFFNIFLFLQLPISPKTIDVLKNGIIIDLCLLHRDFKKREFYISENMDKNFDEISLDTENQKDLDIIDDLIPFFENCNNFILLPTRFGTFKVSPHVLTRVDNSINKIMYVYLFVYQS